jgi:hypothetical protein
MATSVHELERGAQRLAALLQEDYSRTRMVDHYLGTVTPADPRIVEIVTTASDVLQPLLERLDDSEAEQILLNHRLRICRANNQNLADYLATLPGRLPLPGADLARADVLTWLQAEVDRAPKPAAGAPAP